MGEPEVWLLTARGIRATDGAPLGNPPFDSAAIASGDARGGATSVIVDGHAVWTHSAGTWKKEASSDVELYSVLRTPQGILLGTEDARLAIVRSGSLQFLTSFDDVPDRRFWDTPYGAPPELRSLAVDVDGTIYADVHVGWIVRSRDAGGSWKTLRDGLDRDVHMVAAHPTRPGTVFAATADGFHISTDHGDTWHRRPQGMPYLYQRAVAVFPDRDVYLASTARHNGGAGAMLFRSEDDGRHWTEVEGLPRNPGTNIDTWQVATLPGGRGFAVTGDDTLHESEDWGRTWFERRRDLPRINAILPTRGASTTLP